MPEEISSITHAVGDVNGTGSTSERYWPFEEPHAVAGDPFIRSCQSPWQSAYLPIILSHYDLRIQRSQLRKNAVAAVS
jgi:hypothetical protein